jgi:hypothetical protein
VEAPRDFETSFFILQLTLKILKNQLITSLKLKIRILSKLVLLAVNRCQFEPDGQSNGQRYARERKLKHRITGAMRVMVQALAVALESSSKLGSIATV